MPEGTLTVQEIVNTGLNAAMSAATATDGDGFINDGRTAIKVTNSSGSSINVTPDAFPVGATGTKPDGLTPADRVIAVPAGETRYIGPFPPSIYNRASDGKAKVTCSAVTSVTLAAIRLPPNQN